MALAAADFRTRITNELSLLGSYDATTQNEFIKDALTQFCRIVEPEISASLVVVAGTLTYSIPDTIEKITGVLDSNLNRIVYTLNEYQRKITLQDSIAGTLTVFGTPRNARTNYETIILGLNENYGDCLWCFVVYQVHKEAQSDQKAVLFQEARQNAKEIRQDRNRNPDSYKQMIQLKDVQGNVIDDLYNADGITPQIDDFLESDL